MRGASGAAAVRLHARPASAEARAPAAHPSRYRLGALALPRAAAFLRTWAGGAVAAVFLFTPAPPPSAGGGTFAGSAHAAAGAPAGLATFAYVEPPVLAERVRAGELPPVTDRLPRRPLVTRLEELGRETGRHGGRLRMLVSRAKDVRLMVVYGYARLVGYDENFALAPDLLERVEVEDERVFTLHLRPGHRWSDGHPFTAEDFRYYWEDIANHEELSPSGPPRELLAGGRPPRFEVLDETTVRYSWDSPNPFFLPALAGARPAYIYAPSHWLRRFHARYEDRERLDREARARGRRSWASIHNRKDSPYRNLDTEAPTLQPWRNVTPSPAQRYVFRRNPFFHRVDGAGRQLPYLDEVVMTVTDTKLIPAKTGAGESDLQVRGLGFDDFTFLKRSEKRIGRRVRLWKTTKGSHAALYPNLNAKDPVWRTLLRDVRSGEPCRSPSIGARSTSSCTAASRCRGTTPSTRSSPLYRPELRERWAGFDLGRANALLDESGLAGRDPETGAPAAAGRPPRRDRGGDGRRDGRAGRHPGAGARHLAQGRDQALHEADAARDLPEPDLRRRDPGVGMGRPREWDPEAGHEPGRARPDLPAAAPVAEVGAALPEPGPHRGAVRPPGRDRSARALRRMDRGARARPAGRDLDRMLRIHADQVFTIGIVAAIPQPAVIHARLRNVPEHGVYNWEPGAHLGIHRMDTFWFEPEGEGQARQERPMRSRARSGNGSASREPVIRYLAHRLLVMIPTLVVISALVFVIIQLPEGDFLTSQIARSSRRRGRPSTGTRSSFSGASTGWTAPRWNSTSGGWRECSRVTSGTRSSTGCRSTKVVGDRLFLTFLVSFATIVFTWLVSFPIGVYSATHQYSAGDHALTFLGFLGLATPNFLLALVLLYLANVHFGTSIGGLMDPEYLGQPMSWDKFVSVLEHLWIRWW